MINEKMKNDAWRSLPKDFKDEIKRVYNRPCYTMAAFTVNNTLDWLFGIGNLTEDEQKENPSARGMEDRQGLSDLIKKELTNLL